MDGTAAQFREVLRCAQVMERELSAVLSAELNGMPLYIVLGSECPELSDDDLVAATSPGLATALKPFIAARWLGYGAAIFISKRQVAELAERAEDVEAIVNGACAHEATHVAEFIADKRLRVNSCSDELAAETLEAFKHPQGFNWVKDESPFGYHDARFFRLALHISHHTSPHHFWTVLQDEAERLARKPLSKVLGRAPPPEYVRLWERELKEFETRLPLLRRHRMLQLFERLRAAIETKERNAVTSFKQMAQRIADGREPKEDKIVETLQHAGKTDKELQALVELIVRRRGLAEVLNAADGSESRRREIDSGLTTAADALDQAERLYEETVAPLCYQAAMIEQQIKAARDAKNELVRTVTSPELRAAVDAAHMRYSSEKSRVEALTKYLNGDLAKLLYAAEATIERQTKRSTTCITDKGFVTTGVEPEDVANRDRLKAKKEDTEREIEAIRATLPGLEQAVADARAALLDPNAV